MTGTFLASKHALPVLRKAVGGKTASIISFGSFDEAMADPGPNRVLPPRARFMR